MTNAAVLINQTSGAVEWYTPAHIVEAARTVMGGIDLDPASCEFANRTVKAATYFTMADNGLTLPWAGRVWMNHPFSKQNNKDWINRLVWSYQNKEIEQACCITFASTSEGWFQPLYGGAMCFLSPRTNYLGPDGQPVKGVTKGSVVTYFGPNVERFAATFAPLGRVMVPWR